MNSVRISKKADKILELVKIDRRIKGKRKDDGSRFTKIDLVEEAVEEYFGLREE